MTSETQWLSEIYSAHYDMLYDMGRRLTRGQPQVQEGLYDILQDVFLALWRKRKALCSHENIGGWLVNALRLEVKAATRKVVKRGMRTAFSLDNEDMPGRSAAVEAAQPGEDALASVIYKEKIEALEKLLGKENADLFVEYMANGYSAIELSAMYGISEGSIRMRVNRAKKKILEHPELFTALMVFALCFRAS